MGTGHKKLSNFILKIIQTHKMYLDYYESKLPEGNKENATKDVNQAVCRQTSQKQLVLVWLTDPSIFT